MNLPPEFAEALARAADRLGPFSRQVQWFADVASTNDLAASLAEGGAPEGCVVAANAQSAGRGRHGRSWASPSGAGLYVSTILRPPPQVAPMVTIAAGLAVAEGIEAATGLRADLKWPNDVYCGARKLAGLLAEANVGADLHPSTEARGALSNVEGQAGPSAGTIHYVILGIGINVMPAAYPPDVAARATSLEDELGRAVDRGLLLAECLSALAQRYGDLQNGRIECVTERWRARAARSLGRRVRWEAAGTPLEGVADTIDEAGALIVRTAAGPVRVTSGEVIWL